MTEARLGERGRITIPKSIRNRMRLKAGDRVEFFIQPDDTLLLVAMTVDLSELRGILPKPKRRVSLAAMRTVLRSGRTQSSR